ncbi:MAG TPA: PstA family ABC transporter permease [Candidatus Sumerlaeota bacterium]|nr:PstA family ABC transporter permease [Candidatus Sumerlaeota bacterium]HNM46797.1 PstA family ABC transporter permease [Candidatus Sumerlaeota bacterium]
MSAAAPPFLERAREAVKSSSRAPLWALLFESLVRGITGMVLIALLYIVAVTIWHGAPRLDWEFISQPPRDAMMKGGVFPAIFGTVFVVLFMIIMALPLGVFGAVYMVEYAKGGLFARITRAAVNNLAGVPSIVFGLFGLGFFVLFIGRNLDYYVYDIPRNEAETKAWEERVAPQVKAARDEAIRLSDEKSLRGSERGAFIRTYVAEHAPTIRRKVFGQGAMFWAAATLAILVLPVIIVSTEEALRAVPRSMREAAYGLGATKWQVISTVVLPQARTGILTGAILAVARGAGELAPILFVGVAFSMPGLPLTEPVNFGFFQMPVVNPFSEFMHLNYHIYTMATQQTNPALARPIQFATTLVLLMITLTMNLGAILLRRHFSRK